MHRIPKLFVRHYPSDMRLRTQFHASAAPLIVAIGLVLVGCDDDPISDPHNDPAPIVEEESETPRLSADSSSQKPSAPSAPTGRQASSSASRERPPEAPSDLTVTVTQGDQ